MRMFKYIPIVLVLLICGATAQETDIKVDKISRATLVVHDMDNAVHLFRDVLGLKVSDVTSITGENISKQMGYNENVTMKFAGVSGDEGSISLALMSLENVNDNPQIKPSRLVAGSVVLVMSTQHVQAIYEIVKAEGYTIISEPGIPFPREGIKEQGINMLFVGPGGAIIELSKPSVR